MDTPNRQGMVLIVEDETGFREMLKACLEDSGYDVIAAEDGHHAVSAVKSTPPDLILLDVNMPGIDGFETCRRIRALEGGSDLPIIFTTARTSIEDVINGFDAGAVDYVTKPFNPQELLARVKTHLELKFSRDTIRMLGQERLHLLHILSHDLRNPLYNIGELVKIVEEDPDSKDDMLRLIKLASDQALSIVEIVCQMQSVESGKLSLELEPVDLRTAVEEARMLLRAKATQKGVEIVNLIEPGFSASAERRFLVNTIFTNLIGNALKFTHKGGAITVWAKEDGDKITVTIKDTGIGIPSNIIPGLFSFKSRTHRPGTMGEKGIGFGLPLVGKFMDAFHGSIKVESNDIATHPDDHGTMVRLIFERRSSK